MDRASSPRATSEDVFLMICRVVLGAVFLYSGALRGLDLGGTVAELQALGLPFAHGAALAVAGVQLAGGAAVILGWRIEPAALALALLTAAAILAGHRGWMLGGAGLATVHGAVTGGFVALALRGPGRLSYDWARTLQQRP